MRAVALAGVLAIVIGGCLLPAPGYREGVTRAGLEENLDRFQLPPGSEVLDEHYSGTDQCRLYQWLLISACVDSNNLSLSVVVPVSIDEACQRLATGEYGLGRPPDRYEMDSAGNCFLRYDLADGVSVGGDTVIRPGRQGTRPGSTVLSISANWNDA